MTSGEKNVTREFPGGLAVRTQWFHHCGTDSIPALRTKIPHQATLLSGKKKKKKKKKFMCKSLDDWVQILSGGFTLGVTSSTSLTQLLKQLKFPFLLDENGNRHSFTEIL